MDEQNEQERAVLADDELDVMAKQARENIDVPWDDIREARVLRAALDGWHAEAGDSDSAPVAEAATEVVTPAQRDGGSRRIAVIALAASLAAVVGLAVVGLNRSPARDDASSMIAEHDGAAIPEAPQPVKEPGPPSPDYGATTFVEGSVALLGPGAELQVIDDRSDRIRLAQAAGEVRYEVVPGLDRSFEVDAAGVEVRVVGTVFTVEVSPQEVAVHVDRGRVEVRDGDREIELSAGEEVAIRRGQEDAERQEQTAPAANASSKPVKTAAELMDAADTARAQGQLAGAAKSLQELVATHPRDGRVRHALMSLGRIEHQRGRHAAAAKAFERHARKFPKDTLAEDALFEAAMAWKAAGKQTKAQAAAEHYRTRFPSGLHRAKLDRAGL